MVEAFAGSPKGLMEPAFQGFSGWQLCHVLSDPDAASFKLSQFDVFLRLPSTENDAEWRLFSGLLFVLFKPPEVEFHLSLVDGPELSQFELHGQQSTQAPMVEEQVQVVVLMVDRDSLLSSDEAEV